MKKVKKKSYVVQSGKKIEALKDIAPLWRYISRYLFSLSFAGLPEDEHKRICEAVREVDDGLVKCGYESGAFTLESPEEIQDCAAKVMKKLPKKLGKLQSR